MSAKATSGSKVDIGTASPLMKGNPTKPTVGTIIGADEASGYKRSEATLVDANRFGGLNGMVETGGWEAVLCGDVDRVRAST
jgi:hypothetical protein